MTLLSGAGVCAVAYTGTMTCTFCGGTALAVVLLPEHDQPEATVCLRCRLAQPVEQDAERQ